MGEENNKLVIQPEKYGGETSVISMRIPKTMLAEIDSVVAETGRSRNDILTISIEYALDNMEIRKK